MVFTKTLQKMLKQSSTVQTFEIGRPLPKEKNKKVIALMKDELGEKIIKEFVELRGKTYSYLKDNNE